MREAGDMEKKGGVVTDFRSIASARSRDWTAVDWDDLVPRLLLLAMSRLSRMSWRGQRGGIAPGAAEAEDFVNEAIAKTMDGARVWNEAACSLFQHLAGVVVSDISHAATAVENRLTLADDGRSDARIGGWPPDRADEGPSQEDVALWRSEQRRLLDYLASIDPAMGEMAELILVRDIDQTVELCLHLLQSPATIANLRKRMKRATQRYLQQDGDQAREMPA
jgi:hypothetical protein